MLRGLSLDAIVVEVALQQSVELEARGEEVGEHKQNEHEQRISYVHGHQCIDKGVKLITCDIHYSIH